MRVPPLVTPALGAFLGYMAARGTVARAHRRVTFTAKGRETASDFARLGATLFGLPARLAPESDGWRVLFRSEALRDLLIFGLGLPAEDDDARTVPAAVLRSPAAVVAAFLRALFTAAGAVDGAGVQLTAPDTLAEPVQLLLLNFGILSRRRALADGAAALTIDGAGAAGFARQIGSGEAGREAALDRYVSGLGEEAEVWADEIVSVEAGRADVYDITVEETHRYAAGGLVNHNSYWHSTIMTQRALTDAEVIDFADSHAGTLAMSPGRLNPYKIGIELYREIENRWNKGRFGKEWEECDDVEVRKRWDRKLGLGRQKIFEVRKIYNDVMFIDAFMDEDFCERLKLFVYGYDTRSGQHVIVDRDWRKVKERLLFQLTNSGQPIIHVVESNYSNRGELYFKHRFEGIPLDQEKARDTLKNLHRLWHRPVHIETMADERALLLSFDGTDHKSTWI
jgi:stage V sporulation protein R